MGLSDAERRVVSHAAALLSSVAAIVPKKGKAEELFASIINDEGVMDLAQCNEYQGIMWYNKEEIQRIILISALALSLTPAIRGFDADSFVKTMLEKELRSEYKLDKLLSPQLDN